MSTRESLRAALIGLAKNNSPTRVDLPAIGDAVYVRRLTLGEVEGFSKDAKSKDRSRLALSVARVLVDETNTPIFDGANEEDLATLSDMPWTVMNDILDAADKANNLGLNDPKEVAKN